jgi:hypothetical protein
MRGGGQGTQAAPQRRFLRMPVPRAPLTAPTPPPEVLPRTLEASTPLAHLLHGCTDKSHRCIRMNATCSVNAM